jgi:hypothetical protein
MRANNEILGRISAIRQDEPHFSAMYVSRTFFLTQGDILLNSRRSQASISAILRLFGGLLPLFCSGTSLKANACSSAVASRVFIGGLVLFRRADMPQCADGVAVIGLPSRMHRIWATVNLTLSSSTGLMIFASGTLLRGRTSTLLRAPPAIVALMVKGGSSFWPIQIAQRNSKIHAK